MEDHSSVVVELDGLDQRFVRVSRKVQRFVANHQKQKRIAKTRPCSRTTVWRMEEKTGLTQQMTLTKTFCLRVVVAVVIVLLLLLL
jgi:hypothetical protein